MQELEEQNRMQRERTAARVLQRWRNSLTANVFIAWAECIAQAKKYAMRTERFRVQWMHNRMRMVLFTWTDYLTTRHAIDSKLRTLWARQWARWLRRPMEAWKKMTQNAIYDEARAFTHRRARGRSALTLRDAPSRRGSWKGSSRTRAETSRHSARSWRSFRSDGAKRSSRSVA